MTSTPRLRLPGTARTRIVGWVLALVLLALGVVTVVTWRLLIQDTDARMRGALLNEVQEFGSVVADGVNPRDGAPFLSVGDVLDAAIAYNQARPNEKFLGYVDGAFAYQSRRADAAPAVLQNDPAFTALVGGVTEPVQDTYGSSAGEVLYLAVPIEFPDPQGSTGVIVAAYLADAEREAAHSAARVMLLVGALTALLAAGGAWLVAGRILRPLRDVADTARSITETDLSRRIPLGPGGRDGSSDRDELRDLVRTVNAMLDRVETGVDVQRRFVDDAGHELRTPITIVRGHLEVLDAHDPADVTSTVELVDDELERMNRMVSDLLLLARSEQPTFLHPEQADVGELTEDVFGKIVKLGEREWVLETAARVAAVVDPQRVTQAIVALADNAVRYTRPGDRIAIGSQLAGGQLRFWVADSGPGIAEGDRARIFERFARGTSTGPRSEGAGLGLSIIRAIAVAHGGQVLLDSVVGRGATFTIAVPAILPEENPT
ncbi:sensor histidine kinase [Pseudonocardia abyssalis]|jgi:signal transduction histidine kinase|uniref:histidine kinase n=2 Tax=Pseudonocardia abyssalis TaxID=2792008 RepID=A0ABS6UW51_9PSEU|nr:HAMP domain-containing sensor histidine kinase [Pseudonocardia abyssalis]MBW0136495.1 HAMP domain-containing histidine kinase [Pseudonocardia abyssalis]